MSIALVLLSLLTTGSKHGYELKSDFEEVMGRIRPINVGQIYTNLSRLLKDNLVINEKIAQEDRPDKKVYTLTRKGEKLAEEWFEETIVEEQFPRDEFILKLMLYKKLRPRDGVAWIERQQLTYMETLSQLLTLRRESENEVGDLLLERTILRIEADMKWLERVKAQWLKILLDEEHEEP